MIITEEIKSKINRIDFDLKESFDSVDIVEKADRTGSYFEILNSSKFIFEDSFSRKASVRLKIYKQDLMREYVKWFYQIDTLNESSDWIERSSNINSISNDVKSVIILRQMSEEYFEKLEPILDTINESKEQTFEYDIESNSIEILKRYNINISSIEYSGDTNMFFENVDLMLTKHDKKILFKHQSEIKMSDKFMIESEIKKIRGVNYVRFGEKDLLIDYTPL